MSFHIWHVGVRIGDSSGNRPLGKTIGTNSKPPKKRLEHAGPGEEREEGEAFGSVEKPAESTTRMAPQIADGDTCR
jgi:hypothetical protein